MCSMEALGLSLPALCHHYRNYERIYDRLRREQSFTALLMSGRSAENIRVLHHIHLCEENVKSYRDYQCYLSLPPAIIQQIH